MQQDTKIALGFCGIFLVLIMISVYRAAPKSDVYFANSEVVSWREGVQVITISAKGGYTPSKVTARSGVPTELHVVTDATYDCSSAFVIPKLGVDTLLPPSGTTVFSFSKDQAEGVVSAQCAMGMYRMTIDFQDAEM